MVSSKFISVSEIWFLHSSRLCPLKKKSCFCQNRGFFTTHVCVSLNRSYPSQILAFFVVHVRVRLIFCFPQCCDCCNNCSEKWTFRFRSFRRIELLSTSLEPARDWLSCCLYCVVILSAACHICCVLCLLCVVSAACCVYNIYSFHTIIMYQSVLNRC